MFWWGAIVGGVIVGVLESLVWVMIVVVGGLTREGERRTARRDLNRRKAGHALRRAAIVRAAEVQFGINREVKRMEEANPEG